MKFLRYTDLPKAHFILQTYHYSTTPVVQTEQSYTTSKNSTTITNTVNTPIAPDSLVLNNASAILQYNVRIVTSDTGNNRQIVYDALIRHLS